MYGVGRGPYSAPNGPIVNWMAAFSSGGSIRDLVSRVSQLMQQNDRLPNARDSFLNLGISDGERLLFSVIGRTCSLAWKPFIPPVTFLKETHLKPHL